MNTIIGMTALTLKTPLGDQQKRNLNNVLKSAESLLSLVDSMFMLSQLEAGEALLEKQEFDLSQLISESLESASKKAYEKGIELIGWYKSEPSFQLVGDPVRLRMILDHLLDNAVKFSKRGEIVLELETLELENSRCKTLITIEDQGIGIGASKQKTIFDSYTQGDATKARKYGGVGIGLSLCKKNIELMKGEIRLDSKLGRGTKITVSLIWPLVTGMKLTAHTKRSATGNKDIRLFCENKVQKKVLCDILSSAGYDPILIDSFEEESLSNKKTSLTIVDLPINSQKVKKLVYEGQSKTKGALLFLSSSQIIQKRVLNNQPSVIKPFRPNVLIEKIQPENSLRVLIVEDSKINQDLLALLFKKKAYYFEQAFNGFEAVNACKNNKFDIILMDLQMPEMDGFEATKTIRKLEASLKYSPYIIALTGGFDAIGKEQCIEAGMNNYLTKPVVGHKLFEMINKNFVETEVSNTLTEQTQSNQVNYQQIIDITDGIKRWDLNRKAFYKALSVFYRDHYEDKEWLHKAIEEKNYVQIISWAHNIKGVAGNISAFQLANIASSLEKALSGPDDDEKISRCIKRMRSVLGITLQTVKQLMDEEQAEKHLKDKHGKQIPFNSQDVSDSITKLSKALDKGEAVGAENEVDLLKNTLRELGCGDDLGDLRDQIESFEFGKALTILDKIKNDLGVIN